MPKKNFNLSAFLKMRQRDAFFLKMQAFLRVHKGAVPYGFASMKNLRIAKVRRQEKSGKIRREKTSDK